MMAVVEQSFHKIQLQSLLCYFIAVFQNKTVIPFHLRYNHTNPVRIRPQENLPPNPTFTKRTPIQSNLTIHKNIFFRKYFSEMPV